MSVQMVIKSPALPLLFLLHKVAGHGPVLMFVKNLFFLPVWVGFKGRHLSPKMKALFIGVHAAKRFGPNGPAIISGVCLRPVGVTFSRNRVVWVNVPAFTCSTA